MENKWEDIWEDNYTPTISELKAFINGQLKEEKAFEVERWMITSDFGSEISDMIDQKSLSNSLLDKIELIQSERIASWTHTGFGFNGSLFLGGLLICLFVGANSFFQAKTPKSPNNKQIFSINDQIIDEIQVPKNSMDSVSKTVNEFQTDHFSILQESNEKSTIPSKKEPKVKFQQYEEINISKKEVAIPTNPHKNITLYNAEIRWILHFKCVDYRAIYDKMSPVLSGTQAEYEEDGINKEVLPITYEETFHVDEILKKGLTALIQRKYKRSIYWLRLILEHYPEDLNAKFYLGLSYFENKEYDSALFYLQEAANSDINVFVEEAQWFLVKTHLALGEKDVALQLLGNIIEFNGFYAEQAIKLESTL